MHSIIKEEHAEFEEEAHIDALIHSLKSNNVGYEEIMQALLPYIKPPKNISKTSELKLMQFIQELIDQREQQNRQI